MVCEFEDKEKAHRENYRSTKLKIIELEEQSEEEHRKWEEAHAKLAEFTKKRDDLKTINAADQNQLGQQPSTHAWQQRLQSFSVESVPEPSRQQAIQAHSHLATMLQNLELSFAQFEWIKGGVATQPAPGGPAHQAPADQQLQQPKHQPLSGSPPPPASYLGQADHAVVPTQEHGLHAAEVAANGEAEFAASNAGAIDIGVGVSTMVPPNLDSRSDLPVGDEGSLSHSVIDWPQEQKEGYFKSIVENGAWRRQQAAEEAKLAAEAAISVGSPAELEAAAGGAVGSTDAPMQAPSNKHKERAIEIQNMSPEELFAMGEQAKFIRLDSASTPRPVRGPTTPATNSNSAGLPHLLVRCTLFLAALSGVVPEQVNNAYMDPTGKHVCGRMYAYGKEGPPVSHLDEPDGGDWLQEANEDDWYPWEEDPTTLLPPTQGEEAEASMQPDFPTAQQHHQHQEQQQPKQQQTQRKQQQQQPPLLTPGATQQLPIESAADDPIINEPASEEQAWLLKHEGDTLCCRQNAAIHKKKTQVPWGQGMVGFWVSESRVWGTIWTYLRSCRLTSTMLWVCIVGLSPQQFACSPWCPPRRLLRSHARYPGCITASPPASIR